MTDDREHGAREVLERIVRTAIYHAQIEGSSSMEVAASMLSYLAAHVELLPDVMRGVASPNGWPPDWRSGGDLTWHGPNERLDNPGEHIPVGRASGAVSESAAIASWLGRHASECRRRSDDTGLGLASRFEHERCAVLIEDIAAEIERGAFRQPLEKPIVWAN